MIQFIITTKIAVAFIFIPILVTRSLHILMTKELFVKWRKQGFAQILLRLVVILFAIINQANIWNSRLV